MSGFLEATVSRRVEWAPGLVTLELSANVDPFEPGQFVNLALGVDDGGLVRRPYSLASAPGAPPEILLTCVDGGALSPRLCALAVGDRVLVERRAQGFFTASWLPPAKDLWLIATGTGLGPYLSLLRSGVLWERFERVVVVHGVRWRSHLAHRAELCALADARAPQLAYAPLVSREASDAEVLGGRITAAVASGALEERVGLRLASDRSHVMLCGNPAMIEELGIVLAERGLDRHRARKPGHVTVEKYW